MLLFNRRNVGFAASASVVYRAPIVSPRGAPSASKLPEANPPTPASSTFGFAGFRSSAPIASEENWSVSGVQLGLAAAALVVRQTPPSTPPANRMFWFVG